MEALDRLPDTEQAQVLKYVRSLPQPKLAGVSGASLVRFAGMMPADDLLLMEQAIKDGGGQAAINGW